MVVQETLLNGLVKTYSNTGFLIKQVETGELYEEAIDVPNKYTYEETDIEVEVAESEDTSIEDVNVENISIEDINPSEVEV